MYLSIVGFCVLQDGSVIHSFDSCFLSDGVFTVDVYAVLFMLVLCCWVKKHICFIKRLCQTSSPGTLKSEDDEDA